MIDLTLLTQYSTQIVACFGALLLIFSYGILPSVKVAKKVHKASENVSEALPILLQLAKTYSSESGGFILPDKIDKIEEATIKNLELLRTIGNSLNVSWYESDANGECIYVSEKLSELMGISLPQCLGSGWKNSVCEKYREKVVNEWDLAVKEKREFDLNYGFCSQETRKETKIHTHGYVIRNSELEVIGFIGLVTEMQK